MCESAEGIFCYCFNGKNALSEMDGRHRVFWGLGVGFGKSYQDFWYLQELYVFF